MLKLLVVLLGALRSSFRSRADLVVENLALRQQLAAFATGGRRPRITVVDRWFWVALRRLWSRWSEVLVFVKPATVDSLAPRRLPSLLDLALPPSPTGPATDPAQDP